MKLSLTVNCWNDEDLLFASQFGVTHIMAEASIPHGQHWDRNTLSAIRNRAEMAGFTFTGLAGLPRQFDISRYLQQAERADPAGADGLTELCSFVTDAGAARIPMIICDCDVPGAREPVITPEGRAGALIRKYDGTQSVSADRHVALWQHLVHWLQRVVPVAEKAGVMLALGSTHLSTGWLDSIEALQQLLDIVPSPCVGLNVRQGMLTQTLGGDYLSAIGYFCAQKKVGMVEVANLRSSASHLVEVFLDEPMPANASMLRTLQACRAAGYHGTTQPAKPPGLVGDTVWGHKGQAFNIGYLRALLQVVERT